MTRALHASFSILLLLAFCAPPVQAGKKPPTVETIKLKDGVYMLQGRGANVGVLSGKDGTLLIDTQYPESTKPLKAAIRKISKKPVRFLVITHWHRDHVGGIESLAKGGTTVVAHDNVRERMRTGGYHATVDHQTPPAQAQALPTVTFSDKLTFHLDEETVRCIHVPLAHTNGDTIVHFVKSNVIHTGDIYFNGLYPYIDVNAGGNIDGMIRAVSQVLEIADNAATIIPGHGPVANREELKKYLFMLETIRDRIRPLVLEGKSLEEVIAAKPTAEFDARWGKTFLTPVQFTEIAYQGMRGTRSLQTLREGMQVICQAPEKAPQEWKKAGKAERAVILAKWIEEHLQNQQAIEMFSALAYASPADKPKYLREAARDVGLTSCPMADVLADQ